MVMAETIHSGQFMVSKYDEDSDVEGNNDINQFKRVRKGYDFNTSLEKNFSFGDSKFEIDASLQKMFQYLSIALSGKITNPKWNSFKGVKFGAKDKIRLNNIIWREYHMQFVKRITPIVVQFASPLAEDPKMHGDVVLEGKYWKRRNNIIVHQYIKWREYFKKRICSGCSQKSFKSHIVIDDSSGGGGGKHDNNDCVTCEFIDDEDNKMHCHHHHHHHHLRNEFDVPLFNQIQLQQKPNKWRNGGNKNNNYQHCDINNSINSSTSDNFSSKPRSSSPPPYLSDVFMDIDDHLLMPLNEYDFSGMFNVQHNCQVIQPQLTNLQPRMDPNIDFLNEFLYPKQNLFKSQRPYSSESSINYYSQPQNVESGLTEDLSNYDNNNNNNGSYLNPIKSLPSSSSSTQICYKSTVSSDYSPVANLLQEHQVPFVSSNIQSVHKQPENETASISVPNSTFSQSLCKTPNLLSILLQPVSENSSVPDKTELPFTPMSTNRSSLISSTGNSPWTVNDKTISMQKSRNKNDSQSLHLGLSSSEPTMVEEQRPQKSKCTFQQSLTWPKDGLESSGGSNDHLGSLITATPSRIASKHKQRIALHSAQMSTNNVVQMYIDELSTLLLSPVSKRDNSTVEMVNKNSANVNNHVKVSKAALLHKAAETISKLRNEKHRLMSEIMNLQGEIDALQNQFSVFCSQLPATGVCINGSKSSEGWRWFEEFVLQQSKSNWKFYIFYMIFESLFASYNDSVSTNSIDTMAHNVAAWLEKECSLMKLRLIVITGMRNLSRMTSIVHQPSLLMDEIYSMMLSQMSSSSSSSVSNISTTQTTTCNQQRVSNDGSYWRLQQPQPPQPLNWNQSHSHQQIHHPHTQLLSATATTTTTNTTTTTTAAATTLVANSSKSNHLSLPSSSLLSFIYSDKFGRT